MICSERITENAHIRLSANRRLPAGITSVTPERTNEIVNYIAFAFVYCYNENEMTVDNAEVNLLKVKLNQNCGKAKM